MLLRKGVLRAVWRGGRGCGGGVLPLRFLDAAKHPLHARLDTVHVGDAQVTRARGKNLPRQPKQLHSAIGVYMFSAP
eukprot:3646861-Pyramimonas_sp.AAC.1